MFELANKNKQNLDQRRGVILRLHESLMHMLALVKAKLCSTKDAAKCKAIRSDHPKWSGSSEEFVANFETVPKKSQLNSLHGFLKLSATLIHVHFDVGHQQPPTSTPMMAPRVGR